MNVNSGLEDLLPIILTIGSSRYCIWGDLGYNNTWYFETHFKAPH